MLDRAKGFAAAAMAVLAPSIVSAGWPFSDGPRRGSEEYYYARGCEPIGERQECKHARLWPPFNRPSGEEQPFIHRFHAIHFWPYPYVNQDREDVRMVMHTQVANGWVTATTLYDYHFDSLTHQLNSAGRQHLSWIMTQAPPSYRQIHIQMAQDPSFNEARTLSVQKTLAMVPGGDSSVPISLRATEPLGRPATEIERIFTSSADNAQPPVIQYQEIGSAGE